MKLIPVIDLMAGRAVWARPGGRNTYAPLATSLCPDSDPEMLARRFADYFGANTLYIADLDAITGCGDNLKTACSIATALPHLDLWVDAGLSDRASLDSFTRDWPGRPVIGSETLAETVALDAAEARSAVLSLDHQGAELLGPSGLDKQPERWPLDLILMSLDRVGSRQGPDLSLLSHLRAMAPVHRLYSAGGVRSTADLASLAEAGASGVLLASALHDGRVTASTARRFA